MELRGRLTQLYGGESQLLISSDPERSSAYSRIADSMFGAKKERARLLPPRVTISVCVLEKAFFPAGKMRWWVVTKRPQINLPNKVLTILL